MDEYTKIMNNVSVWLGVEQGIRQGGGCVGIWLDLPESLNVRKTLESPAVEIPTESSEGPAKVLHVKLNPVPKEFGMSYRYKMIRDNWRPLPTRRLPVARVEYAEDVSYIIKALTESFARGFEIMRKLHEIIDVPTDQCACRGRRFFK